MLSTVFPLPYKSLQHYEITQRHNVHDKRFVLNNVLRNQELCTV